MIIALAGHVDHGKTALVTALTGTNTDRLPQEQARGLTIDLGFAYQDRGDARTLGFVDVPGHQRFVHNMVAGINREQVALLVVAADDGVMPQTREHLHIMMLLGLRRGLVVINKCDRVDEAQQQAVLEEVRKLCADSFLADAAVHCVSAVTGEGIDALRAALDSLDSDQGDQQQVELPQHSRFAIDRAFALKGVGIIATGMLANGRVAVDDTLRLFPSGDSVRIRSLRANDRKAKSAAPGMRVALNLSGTELEAVGRGSWLHGGSGIGAQRLQLLLRRRAGYRRRVRPGQRVHVYHGTRHVEATLTLLKDAMTPEAPLLIELNTDAPLLTRHGDRLILREHGMDDTVGGGQVLALLPAAQRPRSPDRLQRLAKREQSDTATDAVRAELADGAVHIKGIVRDYDLTPSAVETLLSEHALTAIDDEHAIPHAHLETLEKIASERMQSLSAQTSDRTLHPEDLLPRQPQPIQIAMLSRLVAAGALQSTTEGYRLRSRARELTDPEQALLERVEPLLDQTPPPSLGDLGKQLGLPADRLRKQLAPLVTKGALLSFGDNRVLLPARFRELAELAASLSQENGAFTVKAFRDASGLGRNLVIDVLEHMDSGGYTRRQENNRTVVGDLSRLLKR